MKITIEQIAKKIKNKKRLLYGLFFNTGGIYEELVMVQYSIDKKCLLIKRKNKEIIEIPSYQEIIIDSLGGFDFIHNGKNSTLMIFNKLLAKI